MPSSLRELGVSARKGLGDVVMWEKENSNPKAMRKLLWQIEKDEKTGCEEDVNRKGRSEGQPKFS